MTNGIKNCHTIILGGGPAGIAAALALGKDGILLERSLSLGGLSSSISFCGAVFDLGGHVLTTPHARVRELVFSALEMYEQQRVARVYYHGDWIPYPFQQHFEQLSCRDVIRECSAGLMAAGDTAGTHNFGEYIDAQFGCGIARHFMRPYNEKLWGDLSCMAADWTQERLATPIGVTGQPHQKPAVRTPLTASSMVAYPASGGFGEIFKALGRRLHHVEPGSDVQRIDPGKRLLYTREGKVFSYKNLVSTIALDRLISITSGVPSQHTHGVRALRAVSLDLVLIAVRKHIQTDLQRVYSADPGIPAHKIVLNHNSSDYLRALPVEGIVAEVSRSTDHYSSGAELARNVVDSLVTMGLLKDRGLISGVRNIRIDRAYPIPTHERAHVVGEVKKWLQAHAIYSCGRFGEWDYINSDEALHRGLAIGDAIREDRDPIPVNTEP